MKRTITALSLAALAFLAFGATAIAAPGGYADDGSLLDMFKPVVEAVKNGHFALGGSLLVIFLMAVAKRYLPEKWGGKWVRSDAGGVAFAFGFAFFGSLGTALAAPGAAVNGAMAMAALKFGLGAIGGFVAIHKLATWAVGTAWFKAHAPAWLVSGLSFVLALIGSSAIKKAEAAGQKAVDQNPPQGPAAATGDVGQI